MKNFIHYWKKRMLFAASLSCIINILQLTFSFYMFAIYDTILTSYSYSTLASITIIACFALIFLFIFSYLRRKLLQLIGTDLDKKLSSIVAKEMISKSANPSRQILNTGLTDITALSNFTGSDGLIAIFDIPWTPFYLIIVYLYHPLIGFTATAIGATLIALLWLQNKLTRDRLETANAIMRKNKNFIDVMLANAEVVNAMGMTADITHRFEQKNKQIITLQTIASRYAGAIQSSIKSLQTLVNVLVYGIGAALVLLEGLNAGMIIMSSMIVGQALSPFMRYLFSAKNISMAQQAYARLHTLTEILDSNKPAMDLPAPKGELKAENLFLYLNQRFILYNINFELQHGDFLGLIGPNGAGKTTLMRTLLGLWAPSIGSIRVDGASAHRWEKEQLGPYIGYLPQTIELFPGTIAENIARLQNEQVLDMGEVERVAKLTGMHALISSLPSGYSTKIGKGELVFSGGQKQRIGLARALYGDPILLFLDEPNSNLDEEGEKFLIDTLKKIKAEKSTTCIIITHKHSLLDFVDKVMLINNGQIARYGDLEEVLKSIKPAIQSPPKLATFNPAPSLT